MSDKSISDEVAALAEAVRELKDREVADTLRDLRAEVEKLRAEREAHHCHGCTCMHIHWHQTYPLPGCAPYIQPQVWYGTVTAGGTAGGGYSTVTTTNAASGYNPATTTLGISN
jgi:hypothetical protein